MRKILASLFALAVFLGACTDDSPTTTTDEDPSETTGDDGSDKGSDEISEDTDGDTDADDDGEDTDEESDPEDQARLDAALDAVEAEAEAAGFTVTLEDPDEDDDDNDFEFESEECQDADRIFNELEDEIGETAASQSLSGERGEFTAPDSVVEQLTVDLSSTPSTDDADRGFDALESVDLETCMAEGFAAAASEDGVVIENVETAVSSAGRGDRDIVIAIQADFSAQGLSFPVDIVFTLVAVDRDVVFASALTFNGTAADDTLALIDLAVAELS